ncbi:hypothetical protein AAV94_05140 [Lampropedia cohaerens]|uniref:Sec-independent protein translocase protein TatB n=1 Tax=Lampropedia cohaerens TaxID=1610491 RepID=A0A0U1Q150_9BURK|nr:Sec-independent protein translocase protein TatB [Lampropedia cohaerens]KKW68483.1 hypothetical protein AAV94_05140 [Lampropedia cohaerens]
MFDLGISKMVLIGVVALIVIGPERLPRVAKTVGMLLGKAQRYVNDVKREVNQAMELDELRKMKSSLEGAARDLESTMRTHASEFKSGIDGIAGDLQGGLDADGAAKDDGASLEDASRREFVTAVAPVIYQPPRKNWRKRRAAVPAWYKARQRVRAHVLSSAARHHRHGKSPVRG